LKPAKYF